MATFGYETYDTYPVYDPYEEERRREEERLRLEAETPTKQTVTINPDGTKDVTISGSATNLAHMSQQSRARAMPIPTAPVAPDTYQRMLQIESGNRDYTPAGTPVTSPAGAMFASQVMPATAAQPGFGIQPAQAQTPEEYNRVGREYFDAMKKKYGGNDELAAAAYHSGPGNVDRALQQAQATGGDWRSYLGPQGQAYVAAAVPGARTVAPQAAAPAAQPQTGAVAPDRLGEFAGVDQAVAQQAAQPQPTYTPAQVEAAMAQQTKERYVNDFLAAQNNPKDMITFINNPDAPEALRNQMEKSYYDALKTKYRLNETSDRFREAVQSGDTKQVAKMMNAPGEEGSIVKAFLFSLIGFQSGAQAEVAKMNLPGKWQSAVNAEGQTGMVQYSTSGMPLRGIKSDGTPMDSQELVAYASQGGAGKVTTSGTFFQTPTGQVLRAQSDELGRTRLVDAASGARYTGPTNNLTKLEEAGAVRKMDRQLVVDLAKKHGQNVLEAEAEYVKLNGPFKSAEERQSFRDAYGYGLATPAPVGGVAGYPGTTGAAAPAAGPVAPGAAPAAQPAPGVAAPAEPVAPGITKPIEQQKQGLAITGEEKKGFIKYVDEDIVPKADAGGQVARIRKEQIKGPDGILANPEIAGILQGGKGSEVANIIRDLVTGNFKDQADLSARVRSLDLTDRQKEVLYRQINLATQVNPQTLKANSGAGSVSDAEQKANKAANIDITRQPLYSGLADMSRSQFVNDLAVARQEFKNAHPELDTATKFNSAWNAEKSKAQKAYDQIFEARAQYIADQIKKGKQQGGAVVDAFKLLPTPEWNSETKTWDYGTEYARRAARPKLTEFVR